MFGRLGMYQYLHQNQQAQHVPLRDRDHQRLETQAAPYPDELAMFLRLGGVVIAAMGAVALVMWVAN
ncbi:MAG: hypothetical protein ACRECW_12430 [Phyllobacterium sp.]